MVWKCSLISKDSTTRSGCRYTHKANDYYSHTKTKKAIPFSEIAF